MNKLVAAVLAALALATPAAAIAALAFASPAAMAQGSSAGGGTVMTSEPGRAAIMQTAEVTATVVAIDPATRTVTLKGPRRTIDMVAGEEVRNFDQLRVGQKVTASYHRALTLELKKIDAKPAAAMAEGAARAKPGQLPAAAVGRTITVLAEVVGVDPKKKIISLKGPYGGIVDLEVQNPDHFKVVKKGDKVEAVFTEAVAIKVSPGF